MLIFTENKNDNVNPITANTYNNLLQNAPKPTSMNGKCAYIETVARINRPKFGINDSSNNIFKSNAYHDCGDYCKQAPPCLGSKTNTVMYTKTPDRILKNFETALAGMVTLKKIFYEPLLQHTKICWKQTATEANVTNTNM